MYSRRLKCKYKKWDLMFQPYKYLISSSYRGETCYRFLIHTTIEGNCASRGTLFRRHISDALSSRVFASGSPILHGRSDTSWNSNRLRFYSSEGDGRNASEDKHVPVKDVPSFEKGKILKEKNKEGVNHSDAHARLGEQDQKEWLRNEKLAIESKKKESPFLTKRERFKNELLRRIVPSEKITISWETFPYHIQ